MATALQQVSADLGRLLGGKARVPQQGQRVFGHGQPGLEGEHAVGDEAGHLGVRAQRVRQRIEDGPQLLGPGPRRWHLEPDIGE